MKKLLLVLVLSISNYIVAQVTYVAIDSVIYLQSCTPNTYPSFDINSDGIDDFKIQRCNDWKRFVAIGANKFINIAGGTYNENAIDCANNLINALSFGITQVPSASYVANGYYNVTWAGGYTYNGIASFKQGFKLTLTNPANGQLGYKYGYIEYAPGSFFSPFIVYGWYYQNTFNAPILANSQLTFPSNLNCLQIDTVTVYDTITTNATIYDTITTNITTYDTLLVSVTDTLFINTSLGLPAPNNTNAIMVYPNPANDHITIDNGNFALMSNYTLKIENSLGQQVFSSLVNQQQFYVDLNGWSGNGVYFLKLINPQNNIVTVRKIVLQ